MTTPETTLRLRLYVTGQADLSSLAQKNLREILRTKFADRAVSVDTIDILKNPDVAIADRIIMTPLLRIVRATDHVSLVGNLSDTDRVVRFLSD